MRTRSARAASLAILATAALAVAGCTSGINDAPTPSPAGTSAEATPSPSGSATSSPSASPADDGTDDADDAAAPPFTANTEPDTSEPAGSALLTVTDVRTGRHEGYDRVVFELDGTGEGVPGWRVEYVDQAVDDGSGNPVEVAGDSVLQVTISGTAMPTDSGVEEFSGDRLPGDDLVAVDEVVYRFWFEGYTNAFIGVDGEEKPFRAFLLEDPVRVVIDVQH
ncbi:AMIN-like domain-containing (lipo)protein [Antribacter gilvus]|uniref:AMIN-like domain-containing (lipo)protein n=1 Tax=Antribacter gilvus TaxID=2304675 RepID=UPI000F7AC899|nr:hypothetical protein [Antribacter gilvus]